MLTNHKKKTVCIWVCVCVKLWSTDAGSPPLVTWCGFPLRHILLIAAWQVILTDTHTHTAAAGHNGAVRTGLQCSLPWIPMDFSIRAAKTVASWIMFAGRKRLCGPGVPWGATVIDSRQTQALCPEAARWENRQHKYRTEATLFTCNYLFCKPKKKREVQDLPVHIPKALNQFPENKCSIVLQSNSCVSAFAA